MQDTGCIPRVRVGPGSRCSVSGPWRRSKSGTGYRVPGTWHPCPIARLPHCLSWPDRFHRFDL